MLFTDAQAPDNPIVFVNDSLVSLTGYEREELLGRSFNFLLARDSAPTVLAEVDRKLDRGSGAASDHLYHRKDGSAFWAATFVTPVRNDSGAVVQNFVSLADLTRHKQEQRHSKMLIDELNHRVKNTLATVLSIVGQALRGASDPAEIRQSIESRLFALSRSHDILTREDWRGVGLLDLVHDALEPFGITDARAPRFVIQGQNIRLSPKATLVLSIVLHELATNALKHGALSNQAGSIRIDWSTEQRAADSRLIFRWKERNGPPVSPPSRKGFGSNMIEGGVPYELDGTARLDYRADGLLCTIDMRAPESG
jgi:PAS domain S-box-containing protein